VILLLDASTHVIEALHVLLEDRVAHESSTDPVVLAYALREENRIPTARLVIHPVGDDLVEDDLDEDELALSRALEIVIEELTCPPADPDDDAPASSTNWGDSPLQKIAPSSSCPAPWGGHARARECGRSRKWRSVCTDGPAAAGRAVPALGCEWLEECPLVVAQLPSDHR
jgi:hypothetical protein